jgi:hypothetical protein
MSPLLAGARRDALQHPDHKNATGRSRAELLGERLHRTCRTGPMRTSCERIATATPAH